MNEPITPEQLSAEKRAIAIKRVLTLANSMRVSPVNGRVHLTIDQLRRKFENLKADQEAKFLGVNYRLLIDELIKEGQIIVTNGFVWVRK